MAFTDDNAVEHSEDEAGANRPMRKEKKTLSLRGQVLACLARREHSRAELVKKMERAGHPKENVSALLDEFEARNWLSDRRFAESYVADHHARSGPVKLAYELRLRGIDDHIIEDVLRASRDDEAAHARAIWAKKFGTAPGSAQEKAKQIRFMQSRGFTQEIIRRMLNDTDCTD